MEEYTNSQSTTFIIVNLVILNLLLSSLNTPLADVSGAPYAGPCCTQTCLSSPVLQPRQLSARQRWADLVDKPIATSYVCFCLCVSCSRRDKDCAMPN